MEIWKSIPSEKNYSISNLGNVKNNITGKILKIYITIHGYKQIKITPSKKHYQIHRLIADAFIENPNNYNLVDHLNRDKLDNRIENLRWTTKQMNEINKNIKSNNTSGYKGVYWSNQINKWQAKIVINKQIHLGFYLTAKEANEARIKYCKDNNVIV